MKRKMILSILLINALHAGMVYAAHKHSHSVEDTLPAFTLTSTSQAPLQEGKPVLITLFLQNSTHKSPVTIAQLKTVHTKKVHALIIEPTLTDYHHIHPKPGMKPGEYTFIFTPNTLNPYRIWLDITPKNGQQQYIMADLPSKNRGNLTVKNILFTVSEVGGYRLQLSFDTKQLKVGKAAMGSITVTNQEGKAITTLEPIMEAFAHIVAFNQNYRTILHVHPMGKEPKKLAARGGPKINFHITPTSPGYVKLFAQVKIAGKEIIAPFGVNIE